jgi:hypothetical protein
VFGSGFSRVCFCKSADISETGWNQHLLNVEARGCFCIDVEKNLPQMFAFAASLGSALSMATGV